ncbi:MAG: bifunctional phosphoribosylaminoimidazolecarboxamide formyltransferase/IMP cyclohydrolase [Candidatus Omnitrophica bacterium]|nr:bifunctional phosphoribosylaminoimidazolecarboxamide formyltransferase/IMP cyclohydrolase [Candidatus Omnitrophota bacterium]
MVRVKRALFSCHDKAGLGAFAKGLVGLGVELVASGGTAKALAQAGVPVTSVETFAGITEQLDGRVKTLHPKIHAGILARRDRPEHVAAVGERGLLDLVVVSLYPFQETVGRSGASLEEAIEQIDIGGVALLRAAAKNFAHVAAVSHPGQYPQVLEALRQGQGELPQDLARELAHAAFALTSAYDRGIAAYVGGGPAASEGQNLPQEASARVRKQQALRYGENPHQPGAWYVPGDGPAYGLGTMRQLQGKALSYNNLLDADAALRCLREFEAPACVIIKHASQCGLSSAQDPGAAYQQALACDPESAFGGIVGVNRPVDASLARTLTETFLEVVLAPAVEPQAAALLGKKPTLRVVTLDWPAAAAPGLEWRQLFGGWLLQQPDEALESPAAWRVVTKRQPTAQERADLQFAWRSAKHVRSNGIVLARGQATVGIGQGQPSRVGSVRLAVEKAGVKARGAVAASDGFFPFPDGVELLARAGVTAIVQPGGSIKDAEAAAAAEAAGVAMLMTGMRHFRH